MTRTIKFRAWDKEREVWIHPEEFKINGLGKKVWSLLDTDSVELQQFTGLYDENGKEIYEGDIIKIIEPYEVFYSEKDGMFLLAPNGNKKDEPNNQPENFEVKCLVCDSLEWEENIQDVDGVSEDTHISCVKCGAKTFELHD